MKRFFLSLLLLGFATQGFGQKCATPLVVQKLKQQNPDWAVFYDQLPQQFYASGRSSSFDTTWFVNTVFHVVYNTPEQNLPDSVLYNQLNILNACYGRTNADTINMRTDFNPVTGLGTGIRFELASIDPNGNPTTGITRTATNTGTFFSLAGGGLAEGVKQAADGGIDPWDTERYLNIWICNMAIPFLGPSILGYAVPPPGLPNWDAGAITGITDGIVIQYQVCGNNNPNALVIFGDTIVMDGKTLVHEVGHYLGLRHIWGDETNCTGTDGIADTPAADDASNQDCDASKNSCVDAINGTDLPDMIENYMDYSEELCQNSFTNEQSLFVRWVLAGFRPGVARPSLTGIEPAVINPIGFNPNPVRDQLQITNVPARATLRLLSSDGRLLMEQSSENQPEVWLNLEDFKTGLYLLQITSGSLTGVHRILKH